MHGKTLEFLDRQHVNCGNNKALTSFKVVRDGCSGNNMRYEFKCGCVGSYQTSTKQSDCNEMQGKALEYLNRQHVTCDDDDVMQSFRVVGDGCSGINKRCTCLHARLHTCSRTYACMHFSHACLHTCTCLYRYKIQCATLSTGWSIGWLGSRSGPHHHHHHHHHHHQS